MFRHATPPRFVARMERSDIRDFEPRMKSPGFRSTQSGLRAKLDSPDSAVYSRQRSRRSGFLMLLRALADRICAVTCEALPREALATAKLGILDTVGVTLAGSTGETTAVVRRAL